MTQANDTEQHRGEQPRSGSRRRFAKLGVGVTPVVLSLTSRPVWAQMDACPSGMPGSEFASRMGGMVCQGGCTPGFWMQAHHFGHWVNHTPGELFGTAFGLSSDPADPLYAIAQLTLLEALQFDETDVGCMNGSKHAPEQLARAAVAALLNTEAAESSLNWAYVVMGAEQTPANVIAATKSALESDECMTMSVLKDQFDEANNAGCVLSGQSL